MFESARSSSINFCTTVLNIFWKTIVSSNTKRQKNCWPSNETLESTGEMKPMMKLNFACFNTISLNFKIYFFSVLLQAFIYVFSFKKMLK